MKVYTLVGFKQFDGTGKDGRPYTRYDLYFLVDDDHPPKGVVGQTVEVVDCFQSLLDQCHYYPTVGDRLDLRYGKNWKGQARLDDIVRLEND